MTTDVRTLKVSEDMTYYTFKTNNCINFKENQRICQRTISLEKENSCFAEILTKRKINNCQFGVISESYHNKNY